jgi:hypothetical protein
MMAVTSSKKTAAAATAVIKETSSTRVMPEEKEIFSVSTPDGNREIFSLEHTELSKGPTMPKPIKA